MEAEAVARDASGGGDAARATVDDFPARDVAAERLPVGPELPRRRAEAPLEYLERALASLAASAGSIQRLTDLFEWAKFSHHDPEPGMKDEAIDALLAVRDELRNPLRADEAAA